MEKIIKYLVSSIVQDPEDVVVESAPSQSPGFDTFNITVPQDQVGRVIGKNGLVIKAIRLVVGISAQNEGKSLRINLTEKG